MDKKIDKINDNITEMNNELHKYNVGMEKEVNQINIELHETAFEIDKRVTAVESKIETLKWVFGASVVILTAIQFFITYIH